MRQRHCVTLFIILLFGVLSAVSGCSGGSSSPLPTPTPKPGVPFDQLGTRLRLLRDTDYWFYSFTGSINQGTGDISITGNVEQLVDDVSLNGKPYHALSSIYNLTSSLGDGIASSSEYYSQDPQTRVITTYGIAENGQIRLYANPQQPLLKTGDVGDSASQTITYSDGSSETVTQRVVGTELITVPAGRFMTYKIVGTRKSDTRTIQSTNWYSRQLGSFVKLDDSSTFADGQTSTRHMELTSTTVTPLD